MIFRTLPHPSRTVSSQSHASSCHIPASLCRPVTHPIDLFLYTIGNNHNTSAVGERSLDLLEVAAFELARDVLRGDSALSREQFGRALAQLALEAAGKAGEPPSIAVARVLDCMETSNGLAKVGLARAVKFRHG